jgi:uncharacterized membrane protein YeaQ/YmgE (transglycosylase-associated protein family)
MSLGAWMILGVLGGAGLGWLWGGRGRDLLSSVIVGELGALIGGFLASVVLGLDIVGIEPASVLVAAIGTVLLVAVLRALPPAETFE